jgi:hypothetical protein
MSLLLVTAMLAVGAQDTPAGAGMDGKWQVVYAEEGGRRNNAWEARQAVIADGVLSFEAEGGKKRTLQLKAGKGQRVEATGEGDKAMHGVLILGQDYLCISLRKGAGKGAGASATREGAVATAALNVGAGQAVAQAGEGDRHGSSGDFILILRRQRGKGAP